MLKAGDIWCEVYLNCFTYFNVGLQYSVSYCQMFYVGKTIKHLKKLTSWEHTLKWLIHIIKDSGANKCYGEMCEFLMRTSTFTSN